MALKKHSKPSARVRVLKELPQAFCCKLLEQSMIPQGHRFIVWPGPVQGRGFERPAIGLGESAAKAWESALASLKG